MALIVIVLLALSMLGFTLSHAGECEWDVRLCKTENVSIGMCSLETGGMDVQNLGPVEIQENVSSHTLYYRKDTVSPFS